MGGADHLSLEEYPQDQRDENARGYKKGCDENMEKSVASAKRSLLKSQELYDMIVAEKLDDADLLVPQQSVVQGNKDRVSEGLTEEQWCDMSSAIRDALLTPGGSQNG